MSDSSLILHLFYEQPAIYLLNKVAQFYDGDTVYISIVKDAPHNLNIIKHANKCFKNVITNIEPNKGNDQYGLFRMFEKYEDELGRWIFYFHDKHESKLDWLDELIDPFIHNKLLLDSIKHAGIIASNSKDYKLKVKSEEDLTKMSEDLPNSNRVTIVRSKHTLAWIRELQYILYKDTGIIDDENLNFDFIAGNMFCIKKSVLKLALSCVHDSFFESSYRPDGDVGHGLERFYFYVNKCLKYDLYEIGVNT
jgi:hypothetical protein